MRIYHQQHGFTLLEAIVALVLIATTGMALLSWINTQVISLQRVKEVRLRNAATQVALDYLSNINPMENPNNEVELGLYRVRWQSESIEAVKNGSGSMGPLSFFRFALYETKVKVWEKKADEPISKFTVRLVGYEQFMSGADVVF